MMKMNKPRPSKEPEFEGMGEYARMLSRLKVHQARKYLVTRPNKYPRFLYKYFSDTTEDSYLEDILIDCDLYLNSPDDFNDPFDTAPKLVCTLRPAQLRKDFSRIVRSHSPGLAKSEYEKQVTTMMAKHNSGDLLNQIMRKNIRAAGLFSMTTDPKNILMWSHYGRKHKGMVLQFELARDPHTFLHVLDMHYSDNYPIFDYAKRRERATFEETMFRKAELWTYENEWRLLFMDGARTYQPFQPQALTGIIFGCKTTEDFKEKIRNLIKRCQGKHQKKIKVYQSIQSDSKYAVSIARLKSFIAQE